MLFKSNPPAIRFAVVGLGHFAQAAILPAFANATKRARLAALVTGDAEKAHKLSRHYDAPAFTYDDYDRLLASGDVDAVYIALPNSQHCEYTKRAAAAGVHVLCEKPLAYTVADAEAMVAACAAAGVYLMTAYRLHFEEGNLHAIETIKSGKLGEARLFSSTHTTQVASGNTRIDRELGGGPLEDMGVYCINAARYLFRDEPTEAVAFAAEKTDERFMEVPESVSALLRFPGERIAMFQCGFGEANVSDYKVVGTKGTLEMNPAYSWHGDLKQTIQLDKHHESLTFKHRDQVAAELIYFADCIGQQQPPEPSGREGLLDVWIIDAIRRSYQTHQPVKLTPLGAEPEPDRSQSIYRPAPGEAKTVNVAPPANK